MQYLMTLVSITVFSTVILTSFFAVVESNPGLGFAVLLGPPAFLLVGGLYFWRRGQKSYLHEAEKIF